MTQPHATDLSPDLREALDEVRRIRELVDRSRENHPLRLVMAPLMLFAVAIGPVVAAYGVVSQGVLEGWIAPPAGLSATAFLWVLGGLLAVLVGAVKSGVAAVASRREGLLLRRLLGQVYTGDYMRIALPVFLVSGAAAVALGAAGEAHMIAGLLTAAVGAILVIVPIALPLPEWTVGGAFLLVAGIAAMFVWPGKAFYEIALIWGLGSSVLGLVGYMRFREARAS